MAECPRVYKTKQNLIRVQYTFVNKNTGMKNLAVSEEMSCIRKCYTRLFYMLYMLKSVVYIIILKFLYSHFLLPPLPSLLHDGQK